MATILLVTEILGAGIAVITDRCQPGIVLALSRNRITDIRGAIVAVITDNNGNIGAAHDGITGILGTFTTVITTELTDAT